MRSASLPPLPTDTAAAAEAAFGQKNIYLLIGNSLARLLAGAEFSSLYQPEEISDPLPALYSLVTIFQFLEGLSDDQAAEATRVRVDWKYALHLSLSHPGLRAAALCDFRRRLLKGEESQKALAQVLERLAAESALREVPFPGADALYLVESVCLANRVARLAGAMRAAVEAVAACDGEWMRGIVRPHWYQRYGRPLAGLRMPDGFGQVQLAESIGEDGFYLLEMIRQSEKDLSGLAEISKLELIWSLEYERWDTRFRWCQSDCARCLMQRGESSQGGALGQAIGAAD